MPANAPGPAATGSAAMPLRYFVAHPNIGDLINPSLIRSSFGMPAYFEPDPNRAHLLGLGSVLDWASSSSHVWGSGLIDPRRGTAGLRADHVWALRGKLSWSALRAAGLAIRDVPLGDPGILAPQALKVDPVVSASTGPLGIVPHYADWSHPAILQLAVRDDVKLLDVRWPAARFFGEMQSCGSIASSSLHGLIFAEALGVPNLWMTLSSSIVGGGFKFHDWFSLCQQPQEQPYVIQGSPDPQDMQTRCRLHDLEIDRSSLQQAVPPVVIEELTAKSLAFRAEVIPGRSGQGSDVTAFVLTHSGFACRQMLAALANQSVSVQPVLLVSARADPELWKMMPSLSAAGVPLILMNAEDLGAEKIERAITDYFQFWEFPPFFFCAEDLDFVRLSEPDILRSMQHVLEDHFEVASVGLPMDSCEPGFTPLSLATMSRMPRPESLYQLHQTQRIRGAVLRRPGSQLQQMLPHACVVRWEQADYLHKGRPTSNRG